MSASVGKRPRERVERASEPAEAGAPSAAQQPTDGVFELAARQLEVLSKESPRVMIGDDPDGVHDLRVATRRLQEALAVLGSLAGGHAVARWRRTLRRGRRALGEWRNLDVVLADLKRRRRRTRSARRKSAWAAIRDELERRRVEESVAARKRLRRTDLDALCRDASAWISARISALEPAAIRAAAADRFAAGWQAWQDAHAHALRAGSIASVHAVRIATKRLRYRGELAAAVEPQAAHAVLTWTRTLQDTLGAWHDRQVFHESVARVLGAPGFLLDHLDVADLVLAEIRRERASPSAPVEQLPRGAALEAGEAAVAELLRRLSEG